MAESSSIKSDEDGGNILGRGYSVKQVLLSGCGSETIWEGCKEAPEQSEDENAKRSALFQIKTDWTEVSLPKGKGPDDVVPAKRDLGMQSKRASVYEDKTNTVPRDKIAIYVRRMDVDKEEEPHELQLEAWHTEKFAAESVQAR